MKRGKPIHLLGQVSFLAAGAHPFFGLHQEDGRFRILPGAYVSPGHFEQFSKTIGLLLVVRLKSFARAIQLSGAQKRFAVKSQESGVVGGGGKRPKKNYGAFRVSSTEFSFGKK